MKKKLFISILLLCMVFVVTACGSNKNESNSQSEQTAVGNVEPETGADKASDSIPMKVEDANDIALFAGEYEFSSGVGGWGTYLTVKEDGSFEGQFHDSDMGDIGDGYPNGIVYCCDFTGCFSNIVKVDDYTYSAVIGEMNISTPSGTEEISDGIKYIYSEPYGLENAGNIEFYLPGKPVKELTEDCISWTFLRWKPIFPTTLPYRGIYNVEEGQLFNDVNYYADENNAVSIPQSLSVYYGDLAGAYINDSGCQMNISIYSDVVDCTVGDEIGNITWTVAEDCFIYSPDAVIKLSDNGFTGAADYSGQYSIIITNNTYGSIEFDVYDESGYNCGSYRMIKVFES